LICDKIRKFRYDKGLTQEKVANHLNISQNAYHKIENGRTKLLVVTLLMLADIFEVNPNDFFDSSI
jgi:transcriptional regulator with XRE-family HTH domain